MKDLLKQIDSINFNVKLVESSLLYKNAIRSYNDFHSLVSLNYDKFDFKYASSNSDRKFPEIIAVNYIKHNLTE